MKISEQHEINTAELRSIYFHNKRRGLLKKSAEISGTRIDHISQIANARANARPETVERMLEGMKKAIRQ